MKIIKNNAGLLRSVRSWGALGLVLALAVITSQSQSIALAMQWQWWPNNGTFTASSDCIGGNNTFTLRNLDPSGAQIKLHDNMFIVFNQSSQVVYQPVPGPFVYIPYIYNPNNKRTWTWNQKTNSGVQVPVGTYMVVLAVEDYYYDPFISPQPDPALYVAKFSIDPGGNQC